MVFVAGMGNSNYSNVGNVANEQQSSERMIIALGYLQARLGTWMDLTFRILRGYSNRDSV